MLRTKHDGILNAATATYRKAITNTRKQISKAEHGVASVPVSVSFCVITGFWARSLSCLWFKIVPLKQWLAEFARKLPEQILVNPAPLGQESDVDRKRRKFSNSPNAYERYWLNETHLIYVRHLYLHRIILKIYCLSARCQCQVCLESTSAHFEANLVWCYCRAQHLPFGYFCGLRGAIWTTDTVGERNNRRHWSFNAERVLRRSCAKNHWRGDRAFALFYRTYKSVPTLKGRAFRWFLSFLCWNNSYNQIKIIL